MAASSIIFANLPELVRCLAEQIRNRQQLITLCLVNRTFKDAITPFLYRDLSIGEDNVVALHDALDTNRLYHHVRSLSVCISRWSKSPGHSFHGIVQQMLAEMPLLESFTWRGDLRILLPIATLDILRKSCPAIKTLHIAFYGDMGDDSWGPGERELYRDPDLTVFSGLEELALDYLYEELPTWRFQIAQVLKNSPGLRKLRLSIARTTIVRYAENNDGAKFQNFFGQLCEEYSKTGSAPLRLRSLHLGDAMQPYEADSVKNLTDLDFLEEVYIENDGIWHKGGTPRAVDMGGGDIAFNVFGPDHCPKLRRFNFGVYDENVHQFLANITDGSFTRRLAISCRDMDIGYELAGLLRPNPDYPCRPLHLRMLNIDLERKHAYLDEGEDENKPAAIEVLDHLVSGDNGTLEGLAVRLNESRKVPGSFVVLDTLVRYVGKLVNLNQLALLLSTSLYNWMVVEELEHIARMLAVAAPRLRYIKVSELYWRIWRNRDGSVRLDRLDRYEVYEVELFRGLNWRIPGTHNPIQLHP
ncbi:hypothetical protein B0I37DRAFT_374290 [Chaetomium sp. MPI-CAGE-AT-0009]|nr:hypothetical protein B0I37DRAFT_374290 [Chaetomium sp. MPI-CAGE-AT-0009]